MKTYASIIRKEEKMQAMNWNSEFESLMSRHYLHLPIYHGWNGEDIKNSLDKNIYRPYLKDIKGLVDQEEYKEIKKICKGILEAIQEYYNGYPSAAYNRFNDAMQYIEPKLKKYQKSIAYGFYEIPERLYLYRARRYNKIEPYDKNDIFHVPFNLRSKVSSFRYSIAGYPSLYLSTSLELCCEEISEEGKINDMIGSRFKILRSGQRNGGKDIKVIELSIKPQDFLESYRNNATDLIGRNTRYFDEIELNEATTRKNYLFYYPLIAASSYIRPNKNCNFACEYIIPQILMQWIHSKSNKNQIIGIRYFSCASERASKIGFNYVFPVSNNSNTHNLCETLYKAFDWSEPIRFTDLKGDIEMAWRSLEAN